MAFEQPRELTFSLLFPLLRYDTFVVGAEVPESYIFYGNLKVSG